MGGGEGGGVGERVRGRRPEGLRVEKGALGFRMETVEFLAQLEHHLATKLAGLDVRAHPSSESPSRLTRQWTLEFVAAEAAQHPDFRNLAALLRNVNERSPREG